MAGELKVAPLSQIRENPVALRSVNNKSEEYLGLVESIRSEGFTSTIQVREGKDPESGETFYELVDGLHRFSAAKDVGLENINVVVVNKNQDDVLVAQIMANIHKVETKPGEYSQQLRRILIRNPMMAEAELARKLCKSPQWIKERLSLNKIENQEIVKLIDEGKIPLANAYALARLPNDEQVNFISQAMTMPAEEFIPLANKRVKEIREARRTGDDAAPAEFEPIAFMQKMKDIKGELEDGKILASLVRATGAKSAQDGFKLALQWILHLDPKSVDVQKSKDDERKKAKDGAKKRKEAERAKKKAEADKKKADESAAVAAEIEVGVG